MKDRFKEYWGNIEPGRRKQIVLLGLIGLIVLVGLLAYSSRPKDQRQEAGPKKEEVALDSSVIEKSIYMENKKQIDRLRASIEGLKEELKKEKQEKSEAEKKETKETKAELPKLPSQKELPPLPAPPQTAQKEKKPVVTMEKVGDITVFNAPIETEVQAIEEARREAKKKANTIYLPPSFMEAMLLSGLDAPTVEAGRSHPVPVLLRIKDLAVLPNRVKANLKGCFVIAEGYGDLSTERANLRLVTLSCLSKGGKAVIDQAVKGFVVDVDGKIGLKGRVVSKMGSAIARTAIAGFFGGLGDAIQSAYTNTSVSLAGTTTQVSPGDVGKVAIGSGISKGTKELEKFYLELAKQAMPVIEVGATKIVTLVISEGVQLKIMDQEMAGTGQSNTQGRKEQRPPVKRTRSNTKSQRPAGRA